MGHLICETTLKPNNTINLDAFEGDVIISSKEYVRNHIEEIKEWANKID